MPPRRRRYEWSVKAGRYRDRQTGRFVPASAVRRELDRLLAAEATEMQTLTQQLMGGTISLDAWEAGMRESIKSSHLYATAAAKGGWAQMTADDILRAGREIRLQYGYLERFARQIAQGLPLDGVVLRRVKLYGQAARTTYHEAEREEKFSRGFDEERNILTPADHCLGAGSCVEQTGRGWVPIGTLLPIGRRRCKANDRCFLEYRNSRTGEVAA